MTHGTTNTTGKESTVDKIKDVLHIGHGHSTGTTHTHTTGTTGHNTVGSGVPEGTAGPHNSRIANAADPRVDSDLDGRGGRTGASVTGTGAGYGSTTATGAGYSSTGNGVPEGTAGPHSSRLANALDPRVDSDLDSSRHTGTHTGGGLTGSGAGYGSTTGTGAGYGSTHGTGVGSTGTHTGNHIGNRHTGDTGGISNSTNAGPHNSNIANKLDPRVDSDLSNQGNRHGANTGASAGIFGASGSHATPGSGTAQNTAGPHNSDLANKLDPRVDADLDGSRTLGGNRTNVNGRDVSDTAQVPPSVFAAHHGEPEILHNDHTHDRARRHSLVSGQDQLSGV